MRVLKNKLSAIVKVYDLSSGNEIRSHNFYLSDKSGTDWLRGLLIWAASNKCSVEIYNATDAALAEKED